MDFEGAGARMARRRATVSAACAAAVLVGITMLVSSTNAVSGGLAETTIEADSNATVALENRGGRTVVVVHGDGERRDVRIGDAAERPAQGRRLLRVGDAGYVADRDSGSLVELTASHRRFDFEPPIEAAEIRGGAVVIELAAARATFVSGRERPATPVAVGNRGDKIHLSTCDGTAVAVNATSDTAYVLAGAEASTYDLGDWTGTEIVPPQMPKGVLAVLRRQRETAHVLLVDLDTKRRRELPISSTRAPTFALATDTAAFVARPKAAGVDVIDIDTGRVRTADVNVGQSPGRFDLFVRDDRLWLNNPSDAVAVTVDARADVRVVAKRTSADPDDTTGPGAGTAPRLIRGIRRRTR